MSYSKLFFLNKRLLTLIIFLFLSLFLFFTNQSKYVSNIEEDIIDFVAFVSYPKTWYQNILSIKSNNALLTQNITQLKLLNSKLTNNQKENIQ